MRAVVVERPEVLRVVDIPKPQPGEYQALVRILACGVCGTDRSIVSGTFPFLDYPCVLGHEAIGRVESIGPRVTSLAPGDLVLRPSAVKPGEKPGGYNSQWGGLAEWGLVWDREALLARAQREPGFNVNRMSTQQQKVPPTFDPLDAAMFITAKECMSTLLQLGGVAGKDVLVMGTGPVALAFMQVCRLLKARSVGVLGRRAEALARFDDLGADAVYVSETDGPQQTVRGWNKGSGAQLVVDTTGSAALIGMAPTLLSEGGEVALYGVGPTEPVPVTISLGQVANNFALRRVGPREQDVHDEMLEAVASKKIDLQAPVTHVLPLSAIHEAFALLERREAWKVVIDTGTNS
jgi:L-iditol 2-dehydrogenase